MSAEGIYVDPYKVEAMSNWETTLIEVQSFLSLAGYYHWFMEKYSKIASPLHNLTKIGVRFDWDEKCEQHFQELKKRLSSASILTLPNGNEDFVVYTNMSYKGLGCVFMQHDRVIMYSF